MRQQHRRICLAVTMMCGAECNTDHQMLRMKLLAGHRRMICRRVQLERMSKDLKYKYDHKLFMWYTRNAFERKSLDASLLILVLSLHQQDLVLR